MMEAAGSQEPSVPSAADGARLSRPAPTAAAAALGSSAPAAEAVGLGRPTRTASTPAPTTRTLTLRQKRIAVIAAAAFAGVALGIACWRYLPGAVAWLLDARAVRAFVDEWGVASRAAMVGINMLQVVVAVLPGEPVELASGYAFGFWEGTGLCLLASALATALVYGAVHRWGWRVAGLFFDRSMLDRFAWLRDERRLELVMFVVFLIPGTPKDFLTYFAGLTRARFVPVLLIATVGRIPSIVTSTVAASSFGSGNYAVTAAAVIVSVVLALIGLFIGRRLR